MSEFTKRMQAFGKLKIIELKEDGNDSNRESSIAKESEEIIKTLEKKIQSQQLLVPIKITISLKEQDLIESVKDELANFGFEIDEFTRDEILIRSVPGINFKDSIENIFREILEGLKNNKNNIMEAMIVSMSCRGAIKANELLSLKEMELLIEELHRIGEYTCPHGRPIRFKLTLNDVEKGFKRK
ncbi:MAG: hypothetical protein ACRC1R_11270 [Cetobacterium sp.]|uniref:hypothetical protein n=1 Tax=Cetobacterium sp. TaxID=2071632 RepID=UPI003F351A48